MIASFSIGRKTWKDLALLCEKLTETKFARTLNLKITPARVIDTAIKCLVHKTQLYDRIEESQGRRYTTSANITKKEMRLLGKLSAKKKVSKSELIRRAIIFQLDKLESDLIRWSYLERF